MDDLSIKQKQLVDVLDPKGRDYGRLTTPFLLALAGRPYNHQTRTSIKDIVDKGYLRREWRRKEGRHAILWHSSRQIKWPRDPHAFLEDLVQASLEISARHEGFTYSDFREIMEKMDANKSKTPKRIPIGDDKFVTPDTTSFRIARADKERYVLGIEIDRDTEPLSTPKYRRSIDGKLEGYKTIMQQEIYKSHYGFDNSVILFVTISESRQKSILEAIERVIGSCKYISVTNTKDWTKEISFPLPLSPDTDFFTRPWKRFGHPDFYLSEGL